MLRNITSVPIIYDSSVHVNTGANRKMPSFKTFGFVLPFLTIAGEAAVLHIYTTFVLLVLAVSLSIMLQRKQAKLLLHLSASSAHLPQRSLRDVDICHRI